MIKPLTSLRFFFALLVFLSHYRITGATTSLFADGYIGVNFFFILSGFVLAYAYKQRLLSGSITKREFFVARIARIYPLHLLTFFAALLIGIVIKSNFTWDMALLNVSLLQSFIPIETYYFSFNGVSWSISDEMFFYLIFPVIFLLLNKIRGNLKIILFLSTIAVYFLLTFMLPEKYAHSLLYVNPTFRIVDFMIGIGIFYIWEKRPYFFQRKNINKLTATLIELIAIAFLVVSVYFSTDIPQVYKYACYYWIPMALIIYIFARNENQGGYLTKVLSWKPLIIGGEISFGFYMVHALAIQVGQPILTKISGWFSLELPEIVRFIIILGAIILVSIISFRYFETPMNKWIKKQYKLLLNRGKLKTGLPTIDSCKVIKLPKIENTRGNITPINSGMEIPFGIERVFYLYDIPAGEDRGAHAHKQCHQLLVAAHGSFSVELDDGIEKRTVTLNQPDAGLHIPPGIWAAEQNFSGGAICLVLTSHKYNEADYIRSYEEYMKFRFTPPPPPRKLLITSNLHGSLQLCSV